MLTRLPITGALPPSFFAIPEAVYAGQSLRPAPADPARTAALFAAEAALHDIILYTDHQRVRLVGIFPKEKAPDGVTDALFGFWEATPDAAELTAAAFAALAADAAARGFRRLVGPLNFTTFHAYRLRLGAEPPSWGAFDREPVNPPYYPDWLEAAGFRPSLTYESRLIRPATVPVVYSDKATLLAQLAHMPFQFIPLTPEAWAAHEAQIFPLVHAIFGENPAYRMIPDDQFRALYGAAYARALCPHSSVLVREPGRGRLVGLSFCHPNYQPLALPPGTAPDFERDYPRLPRGERTLLAKTVGIHPDFRQRGLMSLLGAYGMGPFRAFYDQVIFCLMRTGNPSLAFTDGLPVEVARYALFAREVAAG